MIIKEKQIPQIHAINTNLNNTPHVSFSLCFFLSYSSALQSNIAIIIYTNNLIPPHINSVSVKQRITSNRNTIPDEYTHLHMIGSEMKNEAFAELLLNDMPLDKGRIAFNRMHIGKSIIISNISLFTGVNDSALLQIPI